MTGDPIPLEMYRLIVERSLVGVYVIHEDRFVYVNDRFAELFGYAPAELGGVPVLDLVEEGDRARVQEALRQRLSGEVDWLEYTFHGRRRDGKQIVLDSKGVRTMYQGQPAVMGTLHDVTERVELEKSLRAAALLDPLTGLYNRRGFLALAEKQIAVAKRTRTAVILIAADLDGLKAINDAYGHAAGDEAILAAAGVLRHTYREVDIIARLGGDEFTVFPFNASAERLPELLQRLDTNLRQWRDHHKPPFHLSLSTGAAVLDPADLSKSLDQLLADADRQLYLQKPGQIGRYAGSALPFWGERR